MVGHKGQGKTSSKVDAKTSEQFAGDELAWGMCIQDHAAHAYEAAKENGPDYPGKYGYDIEFRNGETYQKAHKSSGCGCVDADFPPY